MENCCKCERAAEFYWPAFDRHMEPAPYCAEHMGEAKRNTVLDGPRFIQPKTVKPALVSV